MSFSSERAGVRQLKIAIEKAYKESDVERPKSSTTHSDMDDISFAPMRRNPKIAPPVDENLSIGSPFYDSLKGSLEFELEFPVDVNNEGPHWDEIGTLISTATSSQDIVRILAVPLGKGLYRLAENPIFESLALNWGDEFEALETSAGHLQLTKVVQPMKYRHDHGLFSGALTRGSKLSNKIHELGGGWDVVAGGILTVTLPVDNWAKFMK
jgi:hypothetical protein